MKQFAIIGMSKFGRRMLDELSQVDCEILIVDKNRELIEALKHKATSAYIADVMNEETITKLIPSTIDVAIVDLGDRTEVSILVTNYLKKMGVKKIIAKAETNEHGEILALVGATDVIFPNWEAAKRITPILISSLLFNYLPISNTLVIAEVKVPEKYWGLTLIQADLRRTYGLNVVAIRKEDGEDYSFFTPEHQLEPADVFLIAGREEDVARFSGSKIVPKKRTVGRLLKNLFTRSKQPFRVKV